MATAGNAYINKRLTALANGEGDYTGLQIPSAATVASALAVQRATEIINIIRNRTPNVMPTEDGYVNFVWLVDEWNVCIEIAEDDTMLHAYKIRAQRG